jgi:hypothetical protein
MCFSTSLCCYPAIHTVQLSTAVSAAINYIKLVMILILSAKSLEIRFIGDDLNFVYSWGLSLRFSYFLATELRYLSQSL